MTCLDDVAHSRPCATLRITCQHHYSQPKYVTCLNLRPWGARYTKGWAPQISLIREDAKSLEREIPTKWIYPPPPVRDAAFAVANPDFVIVPQFALLPKRSRGRWAKRSTILATEFLYCAVLPFGQP